MKNILTFLVTYMILASFQPTIQAQEIPALDMLQQLSDVTIPEKISLERFATLNGHGYIFYIISPIAQMFIDDAGPETRFLEIGAGFSQTTQKCLRKGILDYTANDLSPDHLKILCLQLKNEFGIQTPDFLKNLKLLPGRVPDVLPDRQGYYDGILLDKVFHFLTPQAAEIFLAWAHKALKPNGKLYIFTISPYCSGFNVLTMYQEQKKKTDFYPGYIQNMQSYMNISADTNPKFNIPDATTFFMLEDLTNLLESKNFTIKKTLTARLPRETTPFWADAEEQQCDLVGVVAQK